MPVFCHNTDCGYSNILASEEYIYTVFTLINILKIQCLFFLEFILSYRALVIVFIKLSIIILLYFKIKIMHAIFHFQLLVTVFSFHLLLASSSPTISGKYINQYFLTCNETLILNHDLIVML